MNSEVVVQAEGLSKRFKLYARASDRLADWLRLPPGPRYREFWALREVSFELRRGEALGIIGPNGAGKSTLLKLLIGALYPSAGRLEVRGRAVSLLDIGSGFSPELTGRQNVEQAARLLDFPPEYTAQRMPDIQAFAELGGFFDRPVKLYSSGMFLRLTFSLFSALQPDLFLLDEALDVGDLRFSGRAVARIRRMLESGTTLLLVSHNLQLINQLCSRALWLHAGTVQMVGGPADVTRAYQQFVVHGAVESLPNWQPPSRHERSKPGQRQSDELYLGRGWYPLEAYGGEIFRWAGSEAEVVVLGPSLNARELLLELEPGPAAGELPARLEVRDGGRSPQAELTLEGRETVRLPVPPLPDEPWRLRLGTVGLARPVAGDDRVLSFRAFRWGWADQPELLAIQEAGPWQDEELDADLRQELASMQEALVRCPPRADAPARVTRVVTRDREGLEAVRFVTYDPLTLEVTLEVLTKVDELTVLVQVRDMTDRLIWGKRFGQETPEETRPKAGQFWTLSCVTDRLLLGKGLYQVTVACRERNDERGAFHRVDGAWKFVVLRPAQAGFPGLVDLGWRYAGSRIHDKPAGEQPS